MQRNLFEANEGRTSQQKMVLELFVRHKRLTPTGCHQLLVSMGADWPLMSTRRAITNLTKAGKLVKTYANGVTHKGRLEYMWQINHKN